MFVYGALHLVLPPYSGACETNTNVRRDPCGYPPPSPPQPHPAGKGWCAAAAAALLHLDADSPTSCGDDLTLLCALLFWSNIPYYSRRHGGEVMPGGVQASAQDARYIALTSHVSGKFK